MTMTVALWVLVNASGKIRMLESGVSILVKGL